jgi:hypothetical protein
MIFSTSSGERRRDFRPCTLMMCRTNIGTGSRVPVEARDRARRPRRADRRDERERFAFDVRQVAMKL